LHPTASTAILTGPDLSVSPGTVLWDLSDGKFTAVTMDDNLVFGYFVHPSGRFELGRFADNPAGAVWYFRDLNTGVTQSFYGPNRAIAHAFSDESVLIASLEGKLSLYGFESRTYQSDSFLQIEGVARGPLCYCSKSAMYRAVVKKIDVLESSIIEIDRISGSWRRLCTIADNVEGTFFGDGKWICTKWGEILDSESGSIIDRIPLDELLA
jgi:hypothetical protein